MQKLFVTLLLLAGSGFAQMKINGSRVVEGHINYCADAGVSDDYACSMSPALTAYVTGAEYSVKINTTNTGAATLNLNGLGAKAIKKVTAAGVTVDPANNDLQAGAIIKVKYDGTNMQLLTPVANAVSLSGNEVTAAGTLTSNLPVIGGGSKAVAVGTRSGNTTEFATVTGSKTTSKQLAFDASGNIIASSSDIGSGSGTASTSLRLQLGQSASTSNVQVTGSANQGNCHKFDVPARASWTGVAFQVTTASGTCGGTCGFGIGIYTIASTKTGIAYSEIGTSGHATSTKDINTTGWKKLAWSSGTAVSGGTLTLDPGSYLACVSTDSTAIYLAFKYEPTYLFLENSIYSSTASLGYNVHGYKGSFSTGSGGALALPATWTGSLTQSGSGQSVELLFLEP